MRMGKNLHKVPDVCTSKYIRHSIKVPYIIGIISTFMISFNTHSNSAGFRVEVIMFIKKCNQDYGLAAIL